MPSRPHATLAQCSVVRRAHFSARFCLTSLENLLPGVVPSPNAPIFFYFIRQRRSLDLKARGRHGRSRFGIVVIVQDGFRGLCRDPESRFERKGKRDRKSTRL